MALEVYRAEHEYKLDGERLVSVTESLKVAGLAYYQDDPESRDRGTKVHEALHYYDIGDLDEKRLDPAYAGFLDGWKLFLAEVGFQVDRSKIEHVVHSPLFGTAGRVDRIGRITGQKYPFVADIKTGDVQKATAIQLAGYADMLGGAWGRVAVGLPGDGSYRCTIFPVTDFWNDVLVWRACAKVARWKSVNR